MHKITKNRLILLFIVSSYSALTAQTADSFITLKTGITSFNHLRSNGFYAARPDFPTTEKYECLGMVVGSEFSAISMVERPSSGDYHFLIGDYIGFRAGIGKQFNNVNGKGRVETGNIYQGYTGLSEPAEDVSSMWYVFNVSLGLQTSYRFDDDHSFGIRYYYRAEGDVLRNVTTQDEIWAMGIFGNIGRYSARIDWKAGGGSNDSQYISYYSFAIRRGMGKGYHGYFGITFDYFSDFIPNTDNIDPNINIKNCGTNIELGLNFGYMLN